LKTLLAHSSDTRCRTASRRPGRTRPAKNFGTDNNSNRDNTGNQTESKENLAGLLPTSRKQKASVANQILCGEEKIQHQNREIEQGKSWSCSGRQQTQDRAGKDEKKSLGGGDANPDRWKSCKD
jgi:hypothetical protein